MNPRCRKFHSRSKLELGDEIKAIAEDTQRAGGTHRTKGDAIKIYLTNTTGANNAQITPLLIY